MAKTETQRPHYLARLWAELGRIGGEHDAFIKVIIVERIVKSAVLLLGAIGQLVAGRNGWLVWLPNPGSGEVVRPTVFGSVCRLDPVPPSKFQGVPANDKIRKLVKAVGRPHLTLVQHSEKSDPNLAQEVVIFYPAADIGSLLRSQGQKRKDVGVSE